MTRSATADTITIKKRELKAMLREIVHDVFHEELRKIALEAEDWQLNPESPLYESLVEIREEAKAGKFKLLTDKEVWGK